MHVFGTSQEALEVKKKCHLPMQETYGFNPWVRKIPWRRAWQPTIAWRIPWIEEPGGPLSIGSHRVRHS